MIESVLVSLVGAGSFVGTEFAKEAVRRYAPGVLSQVDTVIDRIWDLVSRGKIEDAAREVTVAQLAPAIEAAVRELHQDTIVLPVGEQSNEYVKRAKHLETIVDKIFEISRRWNTDLLLVGGLSEDCLLTLFKTGCLPKCKFDQSNWDVGFGLQSRDRSMFIIPKRGVHTLSTNDQLLDMLKTYRGALVQHRTRNAYAYFGLNFDWLAEKANGLYPATIASGAHLVFHEYIAEKRSLVENEYHTVPFQGGTEIGLESWRTSVDLMITNLKVMATWLKINNEEERLALQLDSSQIIGPMPSTSG